jgi:hypothetical protein
LAVQPFLLLYVKQSTSAILWMGVSELPFIKMWETLFLIMSRSRLDRIDYEKQIGPDRAMYICG